jgi:hypothetical protein
MFPYRHEKLKFYSRAYEKRKALKGILKVGLTGEFGCGPGPNASLPPKRQTKYCYAEAHVSGK